MSDKKPWEIAAENEDQTELLGTDELDQAFDRPHPADIAAQDLRDQQPPPPAATKSEQTLRDLSMFGGRFDPVGAGETALGITSGIYDTISTGMAGATGLLAGMWPGGESPSEKANRWMDRSRGFYQYEPRTQGGAAGMQMVGHGAELGEDAVKYVGSGYASLPVLIAGGGVDEAVRAGQEFRDTENALAEGTYQVTGSPTMATVAQILPEVASMGVPVKKVRPSGPDAPVRPELDIADLPEGYGGVGRGTDVPEPRRPVDDLGRTPDPEVPTPDLYDEVQQAVRSGNRERLMELINANPAIVNAFDELGIEFTPGMVSENAALRQVEAGMQSAPGTQLGTVSEQALTDLQRSARQLIDDSGGMADSKAAVADQIQREFEVTRQQLLDEAEGYWDELEQVVPRGSAVDLAGAADNIMNEARLAGKGDVDRGLQFLSQHERELFNLTHRKVDVEGGGTEWVYDEPSYAAVDRYRRRLGNSMTSGRPFGDAASGELDLFYGQMADAQGRVAAGNGYTELWNNANASVQTRKALEQAMQRTFGQRLQNSVINKIQTATRGLLDGKTNTWDELFRDLPENQRAAAAATALDNIMFTAGRGTRMSEAFVQNFNKIKRDPRLRDRIFDNLPMESRSQFMRIGEAATGFFRAMEKLNRSNTANANAVISAIEDGSMFARLFGGARTAGERVPFFSDIFRRAPDAQTSDLRRSRVRAAADMLADPDFRRAIVEYANGRIDEANRILKGASAYEGFARTLTAAERRRLEQGGIVLFLTADELTEKAETM